MTEQQVPVPMCRTCGNVPLGQPHTCYGTIMVDDGGELKVQRQFMAKHRPTIVQLVDGSYARRDGASIEDMAEIEDLLPEPHLSAAKEQLEKSASKEAVELTLDDEEVDTVVTDESVPPYPKEKLDNMDYKDVLGLAKEVGVPSNVRKKDELVQAILDVQEYGYYVPLEE